MFVKGTTLLVASAIKLKFVTVNKIPNQTADHISDFLNKVVNLYG